MSSVWEKVDQYEPIARTADKGAVLILGATLLNWLPHIAALLTVLWMIFRLLNEYHTWKHRNDPKPRNRREGD